MLLQPTSTWIKVHKDAVLKGFWTDLKHTKSIRSLLFLFSWLVHSCNVEKSFLWYFSLACSSGHTQPYLHAFEGVQDGEVAGVIQSENNDFAGVVEPWSSCYQ